MKIYTFLLVICTFASSMTDNLPGGTPNPNNGTNADTPTTTVPSKKDLEEDRNNLFAKAIVAIDTNCDGTFEYVNNYAEFNRWDCQAKVDYAVNEAKANGWCYKVTR